MSKLIITACSLAATAGLAQAVTAADDFRTLPCFMAELGVMDGFFAARLVRAAN